jgi:hypothetical protein
MYSALPFGFAQVLVEIPYSIIQVHAGGADTSLWVGQEQRWFVMGSMCRMCRKKKLYWASGSLMVEGAAGRVAAGSSSCQPTL